VGDGQHVGGGNAPDGEGGGSVGQHEPVDGGRRAGTEGKGTATPYEKSRLVIQAFNDEGKKTVQLATFFDLDNQITLCTKSPACVLFRPNNPKHPTFDDLDATIFPIFPIERSIEVKNLSARRKQVPLCTAFCLTDYKVQGKTLSKAILDIKDDGTSKFQDPHTKYCSRNVQISQTRDSDSFRLLEPIQFKDISTGPHMKLMKETQRLLRLQKNTLAAWSTTS
jgi:hypothetical protein